MAKTEVLTIIVCLVIVWIQLTEKRLKGLFSKRLMKEYKRNAFCHLPSPGINQQVFPISTWELGIFSCFFRF